MAIDRTNWIKGCAAEISNVINITTSIADKVQAACSDISNANSMLKSYNGAVVKGTREDKTTKNSDGLNIKQTYANFWKITGLGGDGNVSVLKDLSNEANRIISTVKSQVSDIEGIASAIDSYINSINTQLSEVGTALLTSDMLSAAYLAIGKDGVAKANLATSGEDINNRNFINYSDIKDNGLANTKLSFVLQDDGSYRVYSNGKETEFYTTGLAAAFYQKTLKRELENNLNTASNTPSKNTSQTKGAAAMAGAPTTGNRNIGAKNTDNLVKNNTIEKAIDKTGVFGLKDVVKNKSDFYLPEGTVLIRKTDASDLLKPLLLDTRTVNWDKVNGLITYNKNSGYYEYYGGMGNANTLTRISPDDLLNSYITKQSIIDKAKFWT